jgi:hypothetical protein
MTAYGASTRDGGFQDLPFDPCRAMVVHMIDIKQSFASNTSLDENDPSAPAVTGPA